MTDLNDARLGDANFVRKSPPLIYLGPNFSPFVIPADWSIKNQIAGVNDQLFEQFTRSIPFSVLGLPFYQTAHLPEIMVLAHEIGHVIDFDLGLTKTLDVCLDSLPASVLSTEHKEFWAKCRIESFADIVGALIGGPAFVQSLAHFLMATVENVATEAFSDRREYSYPTCYIRILLCFETLKVNGNLPPRAAQTLQAWQNRFGTQHAASDYEKDLPAIVQCLVDTSLPELGNKSIRNRIGLNSDSYTSAEKLAEGMLQGKKPSSSDARTILSAATLAYFQNPEQYVARGVAGISLASVTSNAKNKARFGEKSLVETDQRTGSGLADLLG